jgi:hypothetical protein
MKTKFYNLLSGLSISSLIICLFISTAQAQDLPSCWDNTDIGDVATSGSAYFENDTFYVSGSGADIWGAADAFHFAYQLSDGDCEISAYIDTTTPTAPDAKACVMIRETLDADSKFAMAVACPGPGKGTYFQRRPETAGTCGHDNLNHGQSSPVWVKLTRVGITFTAYYSLDGETWIPEQGISVDIDMAYDAYIGLGVNAHNNDGTLCDTKFSNVVIESGIECVSSIKESSSDLLSVYPNPVTDILTLELGEHDQALNSLIYIHNTLGQLVLKEKVADNSHSLDLGDLPQGIYYITLRNDQEDIVKKIIKN